MGKIAARAALTWEEMVAAMTQFLTHKPWSELKVHLG
jgi:hypothetical protein